MAGSRCRATPVRPVLTLFLTFAVPAVVAAGVSAADHASIQEAVDRNPGRMVFVPAGDHVVTEAIRLSHDHSGLWGPGRIVAANPEAAIVVIEGASDVQLRDLTLTRAEGRQETHQPGVFVNRSTEVLLGNLRVIDNRGDLASIYVRSSRGVRIRDCLIENYSRISIDDRRRRPDVPNFDVVGGYAFRCISGNGIGVRASGGVMILHNRIIERVMLPTPELKERHGLGRFVHRDAVKGSGLSQQMWDAGYNNGWHQGSAIVLANVGTDPLVQTNPFVPREDDPPAGPGIDDGFQVIGNTIENAPQGMDIHVDHVVVANNIIRNAFMGMKAVHGARNVIILGNQFVQNSLWGILLMPGTTSREAQHAAAGNPARPANLDGYHVVANNLVSDFGYGTAGWMWAQSDPAPLHFNANGFDPGMPPLRQVVVEGNLVHDPGRDGVLINGEPRREPPRYRFAVKVNTGPGGPRDLHFANNLLDPGTAGVANVPLDARAPPGLPERP